MVEEGQRLSRLVENLLDVSRLESAPPSRTASRSRWPRCWRRRGARSAPAAGRCGSALDEDLPPLSADPAQLERAFANLLENGVVHGGGEQVLVRSRLVGPRLVVRVVDRGPGIPEAERERIFEPFYRAPSAAGRHGSGLGLAIARGFIEANGGEIEVESLPGQGRASSSASPRRRGSEAGGVSERAPDPGLRRRAADPAGAAGDPPRRRLRGGAGGNRRAGARPAAVKPPEAAILDLMLPDLDGVEVTRRLREWSRMPILVLSAVGEEDRKVEALAAGADDYVTKPFGPRELVARLEAVLRRARPDGDEPMIVADGLEIDLAARTVRRDGEPVHLTPTEFKLLRTLARNRGRLMTHRALLVEVWGVEYEDDLQVLRAHVANLRRKIEPRDGPKYVTTDPGVGYRFAA